MRGLLVVGLQNLQKPEGRLRPWAKKRVYSFSAGWSSLAVVGLQNLQKPEGRLRPWAKKRVYSFSAGWSSLAARRAHNPKVVGSNPAPATKIE